MNAHTGQPPLHLAVVGGGWAGLAAAVRVVKEGHRITVFEASRHWGGRARHQTIQRKNGQTLTVDNGQHILIGAYTCTLALMREVGVAPEDAFLRLPLQLTYPDGTGLALPDCAAPWDVVLGVARAKGWPLRDKAALLLTAARWQMAGFRCAPHLTVSQLCQHLSPGLRQRFIDPLCVSALNTPAPTASASVFLRVLRDAMFSVRGGSNLLLPRVPLGEVWPLPAVRWLQARPEQATLRLGSRVTSLGPDPHAPVATPGRPSAPPSLGALHPSGPHRWRLNGEVFDGVIWANHEEKCLSPLIKKQFAAIDFENQPSATEQRETPPPALSHQAIATVYAQAPVAQGQATTLPTPMLALRDGAQAPAQFVFDRGQLGGPAGLLAFVVSAAQGAAKTIEQAVVAQAHQQLGLPVEVVQTIVEKRATFACTPQVHRPPGHLAPGLWLAGDHADGPYPATLEGAMRSGWEAGLLATR